MRLVLATRNPDKVKEIRDIMGGGADRLSLADFTGASQVVEDGATFQEMP